MFAIFIFLMTLLCPIAQAETDLPQVYIIQEGDSLSGIARKLYGEVSKWTLIYETNRDKIQDPDRIKPGVELTVPSPEEIMVAAPQQGEEKKRLQEAREKKVEIKRRATADNLYKVGENHYLAGDYPNAACAFGELLNLEPDDENALKYYERCQQEIMKAEEVQLLAQKQKQPLPKKEEQFDLGEEPQEKLKEEETSALEYTIGEEDVLYISVWQEDNLSQEAIVRPDGKISYPLVGDISVVGLTFAQLKERLTERLKDYIKYPVVSITLKKLGGRKVIVLGQVRSPGVYSVTGKSTVLEAIGKAGGFTPHAVASSVILIRGGFQSPQGKRLNLTRAIDKADFAQNVVLQPEDIVFVPKKFIANINYALTQVLGPLVQGASTASSIQSLGD